MSVYVDTTQYQFSHGSAPRGSGTWAFKVPGFGGDDMFWAHGTYSDAKRAAVKAARHVGAMSVQVQP